MLESITYLPSQIFSIRLLTQSQLHKVCITLCERRLTGSPESSLEVSILHNGCLKSL